jgi:hypothetical protein
MANLLRVRFQTEGDLADLLRSTGDSHLLYQAWDDTLWGYIDSGELARSPVGACEVRTLSRRSTDDEDAVMETVTLWRPAGPEELALVEASGWREWPPRLPDQPMFHPLLNEEYAIKIARD